MSDTPRTDALELEMAEDDEWPDARNDLCRQLERELAVARNVALEEAAKVCEDRGREIGGAIQPDRTAEAIRKLKR